MRTSLPASVLVGVAALAAGAGFAGAQPAGAPVNLGWGDGPGSLSTAEGVWNFQVSPRGLRGLRPAVHGLPQVTFDIGNARAVRS